MSNKTVVNGRGEDEDHSKSKLTLILAREQLHGHTSTFHRKNFLKSYELEEAKVWHLNRL